MTTPLKNQIQQGRERAKEHLEKNNSAVSHISDQLFSLLEAGEGSFIMRDHLDTVLNTYATVHGGIDYSWDKLRQCMGIKDKIAYVTGSIHGARIGGARAATTHTLDDAALLKSLNEVMNYLQKDLMNRQNFNESWILRHAAFNNFECDLSITEQRTLSDIAEKMRKIAKDNGIELLAEIMHFQKESDAQQIAKIKEGMAICAENGIDIDAKTAEQFNTLREKIKPIEDLDKHYKHLMNTLNMVHRIGKKSYASMITPAQQTKLLKVLGDLGQNETSFIFDAIAQADSNKTLDRELLNLKNKDISKFNQVLRDNNITQGEFDRSFYSYFGFRNVEKARAEFDYQKQTTFGHRLKAFEGDTNAWRGLARNKVLALHGNMTLRNGAMDFGSDADFQVANSYFEKFKDIFFADEKDAFGPDGGHYRQMRDIVAAIVARRVPALCGVGQRRFGTTLRRVIKRLGNPTLMKRMERRYKDATDSQLVAMIIMAQNESTNMMFYHDKNPFASNSKGMKKLAANVARAEVGRVAVRDTISKPANAFLRLGEGALRLGVNASNKILSNTGRLATWTSGGVLGKVNRMIEGRKAQETNGKDWDFKWYKAPFYAVWLLSRPAEELSKAANKGFNYTNKHGNEMMGKMRKDVITMMQDGFNDKNINNIYQGFTYALDGVTSIMGKGISAAGKFEHSRRHTNEQRNVLGAFFEAAAQEENLSTLMESSDLANLLNLKTSGPHIFDLDGRVTSVDKAEKYTDDEPGHKNLSKDTFTKWNDELIKQFKANFDSIKEKYDATDDQLTDLSPSDANYEEVKNRLSSIGVTLDTLTNKQGQINELLLTLTNIANDPTRNYEAFADEVADVVKKMKKDVTDGEKLIDNPTKSSPGYKQQMDKTQADLDKAKDSLQEVELKLGSTVKKGDEATDDLKKGRKTKQSELSKLEIQTLNAESDILDIEGKIRLREDDNRSLKKDIEDLERSKTRAEKTKDSLLKSDKDIELINREIANNEAQLQLANELPNEIAKLRRDLEALNRRANQPVLEGQALEDEITRVTTQLAAQRRGNRPGNIQRAGELQRTLDELNAMRNGNAPVLDQAEIDNLQTQLTDKETQLRTLKDKNAYRQEITRLNKRKDTLEVDRGYDEKYTFEGMKPATFLKDIETQIKKKNAEMTKNSTEIKKLEKKRLDAKKVINGNQTKIRSLENEIRDLDNQISSKGSDDKGWVEYQKMKSKLQRDVDKLSKDKEGLEKKIKRQEEINKVNRTIWKWGSKAELAVERLRAIHTDATLTPDAKRKEIMKSLKELDLSFNKKAEKKTKFDLKSLADEEKKELAEALKAYLA